VYRCQGLAGCERRGDVFEEPITLTLTEKVEPEGCDALGIQQSGQRFVRCAVLIGQKTVT
jgi:hypothetical protein